MMLQDGIVNHVEGKVKDILNLPPDSLKSKLNEERKVVYKYEYYGLKVQVEADPKRIPAFIYNHLLVSIERDRFQYQDFLQAFNEYMENAPLLETAEQASVAIEEIVDCVFIHLLDEENRKMVKDDELITFINSRRRMRGDK